MAPNVCTRIQSLFWTHLHGEYETYRLWAWLYVHVGIGIATVGVGYAVAVERYWIAALLSAFPLFYGYGRYLLARPEPAGGWDSVADEEEGKEE